MSVVSSKLGNSDFQKLSRFIYDRLGIKMPPEKKLLLESRLQKRLRVLQIPNFKTYCTYLFSKEGLEQELVFMTDAVTTNKTDFLREPRHFDFLNSVIVPEFLNSKSQRPLRIWSSACSTGEEPYTTAMFLEEAIEKIGPLNYEILATDISTKVLKQAADGIYSEDRIKVIPENFRKKYLLRSKDPKNALVKIIPELRKRVAYRKLNLMSADYKLDTLQDIIFCRNVLIYFDKETQQKVVQKLIRYLRPGGYLFIGHSESLFEMDLPLKQLMPATFKKN